MTGCPFLPDVPGAGLMAVVVPARNEQQLIGRCLTSVMAARERLARQQPDVRCRVVVVADSCTDETESIARSFADLDVIGCQAGRVGEARARGVDAALAGLSDDLLDRCWIANTDADSVVGDNWLSYQWQLARQGIDVMIGTVRPDPADLTEEQLARWLVSHPRGRPNGHVHGANLGIRGSVYRAAGGFRAVAEHEDNMIIDRLRTLGVRMVASDEADVLTSGRRVGRTPGGYARHLAVTL